MTTRNVSLRTGPVRDDFPAVSKRSRLKALDHSGSSPDAEGFMAHYDETLRRLHRGADIANSPRAHLTPVQQAAEIEALAAYRIHQSCWHQQPCLCLECRQRLIERTAHS